MKNVGKMIIAITAFTLISSFYSSCTKDDNDNTPYGNSSSGTTTSGSTTGTTYTTAASTSTTTSGTTTSADIPPYNDTTSGNGSTHLSAGSFVFHGQKFDSLAGKCAGNGNELILTANTDTALTVNKDSLNDFIYSVSVVIKNLPQTSGNYTISTSAGNDNNIIVYFRKHGKAQNTVLEEWQSMSGVVNIDVNGPVTVSFKDISIVRINNSDNITAENTGNSGSEDKGIEKASASIRCQ